MIFGNSLTADASSWFNQYVALDAYRAGVIWSSPWNQCNGSGPYDDNTTSPPICIDQPNRSGGTLLSGITPSPTGWVNEVIDPSYEWNDSGKAPNFGNVTSDYAGIIENRDWFTDKSAGTPRAQTSATSPFDGTRGVGFRDLIAPSNHMHSKGGLLGHGSRKLEHQRERIWTGAIVCLHSHKYLDAILHSVHLPASARWQRNGTPSAHEPRGALRTKRHWLSRPCPWRTS